MICCEFLYCVYDVSGMFVVDVCRVVISWLCGWGVKNVVIFFFQAEDGIRDLVRSRGLGDVYKRQTWRCSSWLSDFSLTASSVIYNPLYLNHAVGNSFLSLIHI